MTEPMAEPPHPEGAPSSIRKHADSRYVDHWRGSLELFVRAAETLLREVERHRPEGSEEWGWHTSVSADYEDGDEAFKSLDGLREAMPRLVDEKIRNLLASYSLSEPAYSGRVSLRSFSGASVSAESTDRTWVLGVLDVVGEVLQEGAVPEYERRLRHFSGGEWVVWIAGVLLAAGACVAGILLDFVFLAVWAPFGVLWMTYLAVVLVGDEPSLRHRNPHLHLVAAGAEGARDERPPGPVLRAQEWIKAHPMFNLVLGVALGVGINKLSELI